MTAVSGQDISLGQGKPVLQHDFQKRLKTRAMISRFTPDRLKDPFILAELSRRTFSDNAGHVPSHRRSPPLPVRFWRIAPPAAG